jgi:hypothetical protein
MFSFRSDKAGFFSGLVLLILVGGALISTLVLWLVGGWEASSIWIKVILGATWVLCIATVYVRVLIFRRQMLQEQRKAAEQQAGEPKGKDGGVSDGGIR